MTEFTNMEVTWLTDDTVRVQAVIKDFDGTLLDPTSNEVIVYAPSGANMGTLSATQRGSGTYSADYVIPVASVSGVWKISWKALSGTFPAREVIDFIVAEG